MFAWVTCLKQILEALATNSSASNNVWIHNKIMLNFESNAHFQVKMNRTLQYCFHLQLYSTHKILVNDHCKTVYKNCNGKPLTNQSYNILVRTHTQLLTHCTTHNWLWSFHVDHSLALLKRRQEEGRVLQAYTRRKSSGSMLKHK